MEQITGSQLYAARVLLQWSPGHLAELADIDDDVVLRLEASASPLVASRECCEAICSILTAAGVTFMNEGRLGVSVPSGPVNLDRQISSTEDRIAGRNMSGSKSPRSGMELLRQGNDENELRKLKATRSQLDE